MFLYFCGIQKRNKINTNINKKQHKRTTVMTTEIKDQNFISVVRHASDLIDSAVTDNKNQGYILIGVQINKDQNGDVMTFVSGNMSELKNAVSFAAILKDKETRSIVSDILHGISKAIEIENDEDTDD